MTEAQLYILEQRLKSCNTIAEMLRVLNNNFILETCSPSSIIKEKVAEGLTKSIHALRPEIRYNSEVFYAITMPEKEKKSFIKRIFETALSFKE